MKSAKPTVSYRLTTSRAGKGKARIAPVTIDRAARKIPPYEGGHAGRGITVCAGGYVYFTNAWVLIRMLRKHGCGLPVQFWHYGEAEIDERMKKLVEPYGVECVDAKRVARREGVQVSQGWPLKPFSILHSPFAEVLALDADNFPIRNPEYLLQSAGYLETGAIFWPDVRRTSPEARVWQATGVPYRDEPEFESGQIVINKALCWEPLNLTMWMNEPERAEYFYQLVWGDKDTFRLAWHKFGFPFAMTPIPIQMLSIKGGPCGSGVMCQHDLEGERIFQHRNLLKWQLHGKNPWVPGYFFEGESREYLAELRSRWNGRIGLSVQPRSSRVATWSRRLQGRTWLVETIQKAQRSDGATMQRAAALTGEESLFPAERPGADFPAIAGDLPGAEAGDQDRVGVADPLPTAETPSPLPNGATVGKTDVPDPWPKARQRTIREVQFVAGGHCGTTSAPEATFWELQDRAGVLSLRLSGREGAGQATARLRLQPDGSWRGCSLDAKKRGTLILRPLGAVYPSAQAAFPPRTPVTRRGPRRKICVYSSARGIGDHIASLYACVGAASEGWEVVFHTRFPQWMERARHPRVMITGELPSDFAKAIDLNHDSGSQQRHGRDRARWYADAIAPGLTPTRPESVDRTIHIPRFDFDRYVVVAPFSAWARRDWPGANWTRLTHLLREAGYEVVAIGTAKDAERFDKVFGQTTALWAIEHPPEWVADAMLGAACVIGNDSGMTHFAGLLDVPTLAIHAHLPPEFLFAGTSVRSITPKTNCTSCRWQHDRGYNSACDAACSALGTIGPEDVLRAVQEIVGGSIGGPLAYARGQIVEDRKRKKGVGDRESPARGGKGFGGELNDWRRVEGGPSAPLHVQRVV